MTGGVSQQTTGLVTGLVAGRVNQRRAGRYLPAASFRGESSVRSWLIAIARRQARDRRRRRRIAAVGDEALAGQPSAEPGPEQVALDRAEVGEVAVAIRLLAPPHREVLGLVFGAGLSLREAAGVLGIPVGAVKSRLSAARTALSRQLERRVTPDEH